jgi:hypothetical protein
VNAPIFRSRKETQTDENQYIANQRFDPQTAVVETIIIGRSDLLGVIKYYGGCYAQAITYEPIILPVGTRVRVLGRIPGQNIWVVSPLPQLLAIPSTKPSTNWAEKYRKSQTVNRRKLVDCLSLHHLAKHILSRGYYEHQFLRDSPPHKC